MKAAPKAIALIDPECSHLSIVAVASTRLGALSVGFHALLKNCPP
jgi:hypothetical protein